MYSVRYWYKGEPKMSVPIDKDTLVKVRRDAKDAGMPITKVIFHFKDGPKMQIWPLEYIPEKDKR